MISSDVQIFIWAQICMSVPMESWLSRAWPEQVTQRMINLKILISDVETSVVMECITAE